jgi:hypothetical protein
MIPNRFSDSRESVPAPIPTPTVSFMGSEERNRHLIELQTLRKELGTGGIFRPRVVSFFGVAGCGSSLTGALASGC